MAQNLVPGDLITVRTAARLLSVSRPTVMKLIRAKKLEAVMLFPRTTRVLRPSLERLVKEGVR